MKFCIIGGGGDANNAANFIRRLDKEAKIDLFDKPSEIGYEPCTIPYVLNGFLSPRLQEGRNCVELCFLRLKMQIRK